MGAPSLPTTQAGAVGTHGVLGAARPIGSQKPCTAGELSQPTEEETEAPRALLPKATDREDLHGPRAPWPHLLASVPRRVWPLALSSAAAVQSCDDPQAGRPSLCRASSGGDKNLHPTHGAGPLARDHSLLTLQPVPRWGPGIKFPVHQRLRSIIRAFTENQLITQLAQGL